MITINKDIVGYTVSIPTPISIEEMMNHFRELETLGVKSIEGCGHGTINSGTTIEEYMLLKISM